jgi:hypothetical protein
VGPSDVASTAPPGEAPERRQLEHLRRTAWAGILLLGLQNLLGIYVNLFVTLPAPAGYGTVLGVVAGNPALAFHALLALLMLAGSIEMAASAWGLSDELRVPALAAVLLVLLATIFGYRFVANQLTFDSFGMELAFVGVLLSEVVLLYRATGRIGRIAQLEGLAPDRRPATM